MNRHGTPRARDDPRHPAWVQALAPASRALGDPTKPVKGDPRLETQQHPQYNVQIECEDEATLADVIAILQRLKGVHVTRENPEDAP